MRIKMWQEWRAAPLPGPPEPSPPRSRLLLSNFIIVIIWNYSASRKDQYREENLRVSPPPPLFNLGRLLDDLDAHRKKSFSIFPVSIIKLFPARESLVSDIPAGDGKSAILFYSVIIISFFLQKRLSY